MNKFEEFLKELAALSRRTGVTLYTDECGGITLIDNALPEGHYLYAQQIEGSYDSLSFSRTKCPHVPESPTCGLCDGHPGICDIEELHVRWDRPPMKSTKDL